MVSLRIHWRLIFSNVKRCSTLRLWVSYIIYFEFKFSFFQWMFFNSVNKINRLRKETNRLLSKGMSNIYLKVTIEKKWRTLNFGLLSLKSLSPGQFWGAETHGDITEFSNFLLRLKNQLSGIKTICGFSDIFILKGIITF